MGVKIIGDASSINVETETNTKAGRAVIRPNDVGVLGAYSLAGLSGAMAAGLTAASPIFSFRYSSSGAVALVKRVLFTAFGLGTAFTAGSGLFQMFAARAFTASDTGGTGIVPTLNKLRTTFGATTIADARIATTGTLTAGTRTLDGQPLCQAAGPCSATASMVIVPGQTELLVRRVSDWPFVLANNEGFVILATVPATGTWSFGIQMDWEEVSTYGAGVAA